MFLGDVVMQCNDIYWKTLVSVYLYNYTEEVIIIQKKLKRKGKWTWKVKEKARLCDKNLGDRERWKKLKPYKKQDLAKISETEFKKWKPDKNQVFGTMRMHVWQKLAGNSSLPPPLSCNIKQTSSSWQSSSPWWRSWSESSWAEWATSPGQKNIELTVMNHDSW